MVDSTPRYRTTGRRISRKVDGGRLVARWDRDVPPVMVNESAWLVLEAVANASEATVAEVTAATAERAGIAVDEVGDLLPTLLLLVDHGLVEAVE